MATPETLADSALDWRAVNCAEDVDFGSAGRNCVRESHR